MRNPELFEQLLAAQGGRSLSEAVVIDGNGRVNPGGAQLNTATRPRTAEAIEQADRGQVVLLPTERDDRVRAAIKLNRFIDAYLVIGRFIDPEVLAEIQRTEMAVAQYRRLEQSREGILITFVMIFIIVALLLLAAVWMGLTLATHISRPISGLIAAAERVRHGDLSVRVKPTTTIAEFGMVGRAFNRMTSQLQSQQGLLLVNRDLDEPPLHGGGAERCLRGSHRLDAHARSTCRTAPPPSYLDSILMLRGEPRSRKWCQRWPG